MPSPWLISGCSMMSLATQLQSALWERLTGARMSSFPPHCRGSLSRRLCCFILTNFGFCASVFCFCSVFFLNKSSTAWTGFESCCIGETELRRLLPTACTSQVLELQTLPPPASVLLFFWRNFPKRLVFNNCGMKWKLSLSVSVQRNVFFSVSLLQKQTLYSLG